MLLNHLYDLYRFQRARNPHSEVEFMDRDAAAMHLLRLTHSLEKGLALPSPTPGFGQAKAINIFRQAASYRKLCGADEVYRLCMATLAEHHAFNERAGAASTEFDLTALIEASEGATAGAKDVTREYFLKTANFDFSTFALCRSSVRNFTSEPIDEQDILDCIAVAAKSPSVCNRASARAYYANDRKVIAKALSRQSGNAGFGHLAGAVILVTSDMRAFYKSGERNQGWVDGGLFAMSLNYALHSKGYGVCMLNWSMDAIEDAALRRDFNIPREQIVVMMLVAGHVPDKFSVTVSPRRDINQIAVRLH